MSITLLELPTAPIDYVVPILHPVERVRWFILTPAAKSVETFLKQQYNIKYLQATALTTKIQMEQLLREMDELQR